MSPLKRKDSNFFKKASVSTSDFADSIASWNFNSQGIAIMVQSNNINDVIQYSFDGTTVHGDMVPNFPSQAIVFDNRVQNKIWFRRETSGDPVLVRIEAWRNES